MSASRWPSLVMSVMASSASIASTATAVTATASVELLMTEGDKTMLGSPADRHRAHGREVQAADAPP